MTLQSTFDSLRAAARAEPYPDYATRRDRLESLLQLVKARTADIEAAASADFGHRSRHETLIGDVFLVVSGLRYMQRNLKRWMRPQGRGLGMALRPASAEVLPQPLGTVGVISPWNYPLQLALVPAAYAIAAGNRVLIKPSEFTPRTGELLGELVASAWGADVATVVTGGPEVSAEFASLPFDHLFYTGSTRIGRKVAAAAGQNLTPVTLELGGKSPVLVHPEYPADKAAKCIAPGKLFNAGQTCVAPDYVLVQRGKPADALVSEILTCFQAMYPSLVDNNDYTTIANDSHDARLQALLDDARDKGAELIEFNPGKESFAATRKRAPVIVRRPTEEMLVMQDEIFGPILPIVEVDSYDEAVAYVNAHPSPLAMYVFDRNQSRVAEVLRQTRAGGVTVNDTVLHAADESLPFGGVGPSGTGSYHGPEGFYTFSHRKSVLRQARVNGRALLAPPYGRRLEKLLDFLM